MSLRTPTTDNPARKAAYSIAMPSTAPSPHRTRRHRRRRVHSPRGCRRASTRSATWHPDGSLSGFTYGNGIVHSRTRNTRGLPARMWDSLYGVSRFDHSYAYDGNGNLTQLTDGVDYSENRFMAYDSRDRLTQANAPYLYGEEIFDYDALDNVRRAAIYALGGGSYLLDYRFVYDANQRLDRINDAIGTLLWDYSHNAHGETTWRSGAGNTWNYAWSAAGRMTQGGNESYVYDAHGHRTRASRSGTGSTRYQVHNRSGKLLYVEDSRDDQRIDYLHLGSKLIAQRSRPLYGSTATVTYHHTDHLGSASVETNASGTQTQRTLRTPYGSPYDGLYREGPGFAGHVTDTATNLTYMQQRYYDPVAMRFISVDPVDVSGANGSNFSRYWYANNNPYTNIDPDGRRCVVANSGSVYCMRRDIYRAFDRGAAGSTRFFGAAAMTVEYLANRDILGVRFAGSMGAGISPEANQFLDGVSSALYSLNAETYSQIINGSLSGRGLDAKLVNMEQTAVQAALDALSAEQRDRIIGSINSSFGSRWLASGHSADKAYNRVLDRVEKGLGRSIDFGKQSDREAIGNALIKNLRSSGACTATGTRIRSC